MNAVVVGVGMRTPVGLYADATAAAVRSGISRLGVHPTWVDKTGEPMKVALDGRLDPTAPLPERWKALAGSAMAESLGAVRPDAKVGLFVALAEPGVGWEPDVARQALSGLVREAPVPFSDVRVFPKGNAAGYAALETALALLRQGVLEVAVLLGADSYIDAVRLEGLDKERQLQNVENRIGFIPGEGAAACVLCSSPVARSLGLRPLVGILGVGTATESALIKTDDVCVGKGLAEAIRAATAGMKLPEQKIGRTLCDINGESYRSEEFMYVPLRIQAPFVDANRYEAPADCVGDIGAASCPFHIGLVAAWARRGVRQASYAMTWASSEGGLRGAAALQVLGARS